MKIYRTVEAVVLPAATHPVILANGPEFGAVRRRNLGAMLCFLLLLWIGRLQWTLPSGEAVRETCPV